MGEGDAPPDIHIQHDPPPIYYCWKYWIQTGEFSEGCTDVKSSPQNFLDLNEWGWVYIVIPIAALFLLIFLFYCFCRGNSSKPAKQILLSEPSESDDEEVFRPRNKSSAPYRAVPVRNSDARNYYTVVPIDPSDPRKMPLHGGIDPLHPGYPSQQRLYPRLTAMRKQAGLNGQTPPKTNGNVRSKPAETSQLPNDYHPDPTSITEVQPKTVPRNQHQDSSSEDSSDE